MAEPQPSQVHEGATGPRAAEIEEGDAAQPKSAEDRKTAAALSSLDARGDDDAATGKEIDTEALGKAMKILDVGGKAASVKKTVKDEGKEKEEKRKAAIKVKAEDVGFLVEELELTKAKATDLLRANDGETVKALKAFVAASA
ncbi:MAG: hypothetical protein M1819_005230 [Sarea resinae]|nr:MAG: hypothetical protein M1819_005230 [Sarea resinae]